MKFTKKYETYMRGFRMEEELPGVGLKRLKKMLKKCRSELTSHHEMASSSDAAGGGSRCAGHCSVCNGSFFPSLLNEMSAVVGCFNEKAKKPSRTTLGVRFQEICHVVHQQVSQGPWAIDTARYIIRSKGRSSKLKPRACTLRYFSPHGCLS